MKYFAYNPEIELQLTKIKKTITLSMNGITSDRMKEANITYKENFGVSLPRIKEISQYYTPEKQLAEQLWNQKIREMMILATLLYPNSEFKEEIAREWITDLSNEEIAQQFSSNLLSKIDISTTTVDEWLKTKNQYTIAGALLYVGKRLNLFNNEFIENIIKVIITLSNQADIKIFHSMSVCLRLICRSNKEIADIILEKIKDFDKQPIFSQKYIHNEVMQEYTFIYGTI